MFIFKPLGDLTQFNAQSNSASATFFDKVER